MPDKLTDSEIVKAKAHFEYGIKCDIFQEPVLSYAKTVLEAFEEVNRLQAENKNLKAEVEKQKKKVEMRNIFIEKQKSENEDIKFLYENLKEEHLEIIKAIKHTKAEAYKEFAERLEETKFKHGNDYIIYADNIDNLLKELVGD